MCSDALESTDLLNLNMGAVGAVGEICHVAGRYEMECHDSDGNLLWSEQFDNLVVNSGQNLLLVSGVGAANSQFMGLISSTSFGTIVAGDVMTSHSGWLEAGSTNAPTYSGTRPALTFGAPSAGTIAVTSTQTFAMTGPGTIEGAFISFGSGASDVIGNTGGVLLSAGQLGTPQPVINGNTITMSYALNL